MRAVVYEQFGTRPTVRSVAEPDCPPDGAVVEVRATGVCRSDWHGWMGHDPDITVPHVPGHEWAGVILEVGGEVTGWVPGARVTAPFVCACGRCPICLEGNETVCPNQTQPGFTYWGSFAERVVVDRADVNLVALPDDVDFVTAAGLGCRFATAYRALVHLGEVRADQSVAVFGCGGVGLSAVMIAASRGARVVAVDVSPAALDLAVALGADVPIVAGNPSTGTDAVAAVREATSGGAHVTVDAIGRAGTLADAVASLRPRGRHIQVGLLLAGDARPPVDMGRVVSRELQLLGSHGMAARDYPPMLAEIAAGRLDPSRLVARTIGLDEAPAALAGMDGSGQAGTTVVSLTPP